MYKSLIDKHESICFIRVTSKIVCNIIFDNIFFKILQEKKMVNAFIFFHLTRLNFLQVVNLNYGMKDKNPIDFVRFYTKENPNVAIEVKKDEV